MKSIIGAFYLLTLFSPNIPKTGWAQAFYGRASTHPVPLPVPLKSHINQRQHSDSNTPMLVMYSFTVQVDGNNFLHFLLDFVDEGVQY